MTGPRHISEVLPDAVAAWGIRRTLALPDSAWDMLSRLADSEAVAVDAVVRRIVLDELTRLRRAA